MSLTGTRVALLVEDEYQELEAWYPNLRLQEEGASVTVVGSGTKTTYAGESGYPIDVDTSADQVSGDDFDAVVIPGGYAPDHMRLHPEMIDLVRQVHGQGKLVAAICHAPWVLISAGIVTDGRRIAAYAPLHDDVVNAGGEWVDEEVVVDGNVITARTPVDLPAFGREIVRYLGGATGDGEAQAPALAGHETV